MIVTPNSLETLRNLILKAKHAYYYSGEPIMSDADFDALEGITSEFGKIRTLSCRDIKPTIYDVFEA